MALTPRKLGKIVQKITLVVSTRYLFENWLSAALRYLLIKYGLVSGFVIIKCGGKLYKLCPSLYRFVINNYYNDNYNRDKTIAGLECFEAHTFRSVATSIKIIPPCLVEFDYVGKRVRLFDPFPFLQDILFENFYGGAYDELDVRGRVVVDVGAGIGDTAILFLSRGASRVIGLEPHPRLFDLACINVRINGLEDRVELLNAALATSNGYTYAPEEETREYTLFKPASQGRLIKTMTLRSIVESYGIVDGVLKMDCEGCEYQVLEHINVDTLKAFRQITVEYHNGPEPLISLLKDAGYDVVVKPIRSTSTPVEKQGYIVAKL